MSADSIGHDHDADPKAGRKKSILGNGWFQTFIATGTIAGLLAGGLNSGPAAPDVLQGLKNDETQATSQLSEKQASFFASNKAFQIACQDKLMAVAVIDTPSDDAVTDQAKHVKASPDCKDADENLLIASLARGNDLRKAKEAHDSAHDELQTTQKTTYVTFENDLGKGLREGASAFALWGGLEALAVAGLISLRRRHS